MAYATCPDTTQMHRWATETLHDVSVSDCPMTTVPAFQRPYRTKSLRSNIRNNKDIGPVYFNRNYFL